MPKNTFSLKETLDLPKEYYSIDKPKQHISNAIKTALEDKNLSVRAFSQKLENFSHPQLHRITSRKNYNIDTLLKVLHELDLEIVVQKKGN